MSALEFWFEYGSTYTYPTVARIRKAAHEQGVEVEWKPFLLMPIMNEQGMPQGPFLAHPKKLKYMWRDLERRAGLHGIPYRKPLQYPPPEVLTSARLGVLGAQEGWCADFTEKVFEMHWTQDCPIGSKDNLYFALRHVGEEPEEAIARARSSEAKDALRRQTALAAQLGIFGSPNFVVDGELFWGDDRLEHALAWAVQPDARNGMAAPR